MLPSDAALPLSDLLLVGAGRMGLALLRGWLRDGVPASRIHIVEPDPSPMLLALVAERGIRLDDGVAALPVSTVVVAVKPGLLEAALDALAGRLPDGVLLVSILAGRTTVGLRRACPGTRGVIRAMPNLPASIGRGAIAAFAGPGSAPADRAEVQGLLGGLGLLIWVEDEALMDAATAVAGSGPAYLFRFVECLTEAGRRGGLPADIAARLARATFEGAAALSCQEAGGLAALREAVTSPGGTTAAGLAALDEEEALQRLLDRTVAAAARRSGELAGA